MKWSNQDVIEVETSALIQEADHKSCINHLGITAIFKHTPSTVTRAVYHNWVYQKPSEAKPKTESSPSVASVLCAQVSW